MKDIKDTPLFTEGHRNTLRPCPIHNTENLMELGKHSHKYLVFTCTECGKRDVRNNNAVTHKTANVCCQLQLEALQLPSCIVVRRTKGLQEGTQLVLWQLARVSDALGRGADARYWLLMLLDVVERDAGALVTLHLGSVTCRYGSEAEAAAHFRAAFAAHDVNIKELWWLSVRRVKQQRHARWEVWRTHLTMRIVDTGDRSLRCESQAKSWAIRHVPVATLGLSLSRGQHYGKEKV